MYTALREYKSERGKEYRIFQGNALIGVVPDPDFGAEIQVGKKIFHVRQVSAGLLFWRGHYQLETGTEIIAKTEFLNVERTKFQCFIFSENKTYLTKTPLLKESYFEVFLNRENLGKISKEKTSDDKNIYREIRIELPDSISMPVQMFMLWCALQLWDGMLP